MPTSIVKNATQQRLAKVFSFSVSDFLFSPRRYTFFLTDLAVVYAGFHAAAASTRWGGVSVVTDQFKIAGVLYAVTFALMALGLGFYDRSRRSEYSNVLRIASLASLLALLTSLLFVYFVLYSRVGRLTLLAGTAGAYGAVVAVHLAIAWVLRRSPYRFTIVGQSPTVDEILAHFAKQSRGPQIYVHVPWQTILPEGATFSYERLLASRVDDIILTKNALSDPRMIEAAIHALQGKFLLVDEVTFYSQIFERFPVDVIDKAWVLREGIARRQMFHLLVKRVFDVVVSAVAMVVLSPVLLLIGLAIRFTSPGPVLFVQPRQGRYFTPFKMYKFRTMRTEESKLDASGGFTKAGDARVTGIGKLLRPLHLDELPQLLNIFLGHMSLVGPRPEALPFAHKMREHVPLYELRYLVRPGLTGHAQINQGYAMDSIEDTKRKLSFDLFYLCRHSIWLDLLIVLRTVFFLTRGAR
jgi:exopolysaccharide biosynthesis polyprenyl glycosylphosphotransferase